MEHMRIGLFGGTFNPIHFGHLRTALEVKEYFALDRITLIPSAIPPHKAKEGVADPEDRMEMVRLAVKSCPDFSVSDAELKRSGFSYTVDTVRHFKAALSDTAEIFLIIGLDAFMEIKTWKSYSDLFDMVPIIVMTRPESGGYVNPSIFLKEKISYEYTFSKTENGYIHQNKQPVYFLEVTQLAISSTRIRNLVKVRKDIHFLLPETVQQYITSKGLYL
ncbi:MAG: nicotinate-nucleotide adenylyltransferase [Desulfobacterales bacterium]|nr:nicotinate-nucleotide adenylyltransferase [Desulfobacterales bacterium]